ncbi:MAG: serine/threonine protein kinase [Rhodospirillales bacterium]|nr:serine/threonine protein kinase [Rhodospirillales bacterium]
MSPACSPVGTILDGRWRLGAEIARAGAVLRRGTDLLQTRAVALKLPGAACDRGAWCGDIATEAAMLARFGARHRRIVALRGRGMAAGLPFLALDLLAGPDLRALLVPGKPLATAQVAALLGSIAEALALLHRDGVVHGDVSPGNLVLADDGVPVLVDFATARAAGTPWPRVLNPAYAAPAQFRAAQADPRDDVYALAVIAYEALAGHHPFARRVVQPGETPPPPPALAPAAWTVLRAALDGDAAARPCDIRDLAAALRRAVPWPARMRRAVSSYAGTMPCPA